MKTGVLILTLAAAVSAAPAAAQKAASDADEKAVMAVVNRLFDAMRTRDSVALKSVFAPNARLLGLGRDGQSVSVTPAEQFINANVTSTGPAWNETIYKPEVRIDQYMATVWTEYDFHLGTQLSHCGVNALQLLKLPEGWKIVSVADTRQREGCPKRN